MAYYSEWVKAWKRDTSREAIQKHYEETGEDENTQLIEMLCHQTDREYRIMMGTDIRIRRDPLAMRMREDQIKQSNFYKDKNLMLMNFICFMIVQFLFEYQNQSCFIHPPFYNKYNRAEGMYSFHGAHGDVMQREIVRDKKRDPCDEDRERKNF